MREKNGAATPRPPAQLLPGMPQALLLPAQVRPMIRFEDASERAGVDFRHSFGPTFIIVSKTASVTSLSSSPRWLKTL